MNYIYKHWRGELPLVISFWINLILLNFFLLTGWIFFYTVEWLKVLQLVIV